MPYDQSLKGVFAAALTPLKADFAPDIESIPVLLDFLAKRGCQGALLLGTTGEGPSFSAKERHSILKAAVSVRDTHPSFRLMAGTGTPSLEETAGLTRMAFNLGMDAVVVLPPYYFRSTTDDGLFAWYDKILSNSVPAGGAFFAYHIPSVSGVGLSLDLLGRMKDAHPDRFTGLKDSSADGEFARDLGRIFGRDLTVFNGTDRLFSLALDAQAAGCITALANLFSPDLQEVWNAHRSGEANQPAQQRLNHARQILEKYPPPPSLLKGLLGRWHDFPTWPVRPPLLPIPENILARVDSEMQTLSG
jgi:4-hydroxy-tetrahydrodipicolinate synthase